MAHKQTLIPFILAQVEAHGSQRAYALHLGVSQAYLSDVINGRRHISEEMAAKLGFTKVTVFEKAAAK